MKLPAILLAASIAGFGIGHAQGDSLSISQRFHHETSYGDEGSKAETPHWGKEVPLYKSYEGAKKIKLEPLAGTGVTLEKALDERKSTRSFAEKHVSLDLVARVLLAADGITHSSRGYQMRTAPSGGALYPIDIYIAAADVESLEDGLYHFHVADSSLDLVKEGDFSSQLHKASNGQAAVGFSPLTVILAARWDRSTVKYSDRGYRYCYIEAGCISQNISLQCAALGLGTVVVGAFNDDRLNEFLGVDPKQEAAILMMPIGWPSQ
ncbi:MAG: SagB/ThcOx family dehydrogenase [Candidatus Zixiibacteriota bacterium]